MFEQKMFEIRDRMTMIPALATMIDVSNTGVNIKVCRMLRRCGFSGAVIMLTNMQTGKNQWDCYDWNDRTMKTAHHYIQENWEKIKNGGVIDVEFILGETSSPVKSEFDYE